MRERIQAIDARMTALDAELQGLRTEAFGQHRVLMEARQAALEENEEIRAMDEEIRQKQQEILALRQRFNERLFELAKLDDSQPDPRTLRERIAEGARERQELEMERRRLALQLERAAPSRRPEPGSTDAVTPGTGRE